MELTVILKSHLKEKPLISVRNENEFIPLRIQQYQSENYINRAKVNLEEKPYILSVSYMNEEIERKINLKNDFILECTYYGDLRFE